MKQVKGKLVFICLVLAGLPGFMYFTPAAQAGFYAFAPSGSFYSNFKSTKELLLPAQAVKISSGYIIPPQKPVQPHIHSSLSPENLKEEVPRPDAKPVFEVQDTKLIAHAPPPEKKPDDYKGRQHLQSEKPGQNKPHLSERTYDPPSPDVVPSQEVGDPPQNEANKLSRHFPLPDIRQIAVDTVLVPKESAVISSTRDDEIRYISVSNGDRFEKGDLLVEYKCEDLKAQANILAGKEKLARQKENSGQSLFKLDMISRTQKLELQTQSNSVLGEQKKLAAQMDRCEIRAPYDGFVIERLANENEYTRSERVLLEIVAGKSLNAEMLLPSNWLRWANVGAPLNIYIEEIDKVYEARIIRMHGRIDPASKTIQVVARINDTNDRLLPGMSGQATINLERIRQEGIPGYLEQPRQF